MSPCSARSNYVEKLKSIMVSTKKVFLGRDKLGDGANPPPCEKSVVTDRVGRRYASLLHVFVLNSVAYFKMRCFRT